MKNSDLSFILKQAMFTCILIGSTLTSWAQIPGVYHYDSSGYCKNQAGGGSLVMWTGPASAVTPGDQMTFYVDWGDGNTSTYPNQTIYISSTAYTYAVPVSHQYANAGWYNIIIVGEIPGNLSDTLFDSVNVSATCGHLSSVVRLDDGDGIFELWGQDFIGTGIPVTLTTPAGSYGALTNTNGYTYISNIDHLQPTYDLTIDPAWLSAQGFSIISPAGGSYTMTGTPFPVASYEFLLNCGGTYNDLSTSAWGAYFRAGQSTGMLCTNVSSASCSGTPANTTITITFDPMLTVFSSTLPSYSVSGNTITATINALAAPASYATFFTVPGTTPAFTPLDFNVQVSTGSYTDTNPQNNTDIVHSEVRNSWDPNDKNTNAGPVIDPNTTEEITYTIRFQNMGNDYAYNISVADTIDAQFDLSTFRLLDQSHDVSYSIDPATRKITFSFPNIYLAPQSVNDALSRGYIKYKIKENTNLPFNSVLRNTAYIYFDENPPVITNTTENINAFAGMESITPEESVVIYPQPAGNICYIKGIDLYTIESIQITDLNGKVIVQNSTITGTNGINTEGLQNGVYMITLKTAGTIISKKLIVNH